MGDAGQPERVHALNCQRLAEMARNADSTGLFFCPVALALQTLTNGGRTLVPIGAPRQFGHDDLI
jgi:hypothetical protein